MFRNKILKILPFWLSGIAVYLGLQLIFLSNPNYQAPVSKNSANPMVLGAFTSLRGEIDIKPASKMPAKTEEPDLGAVTAKGFLVYDAKSGSTLAEKNSAEKYSIASLTKLLTALVVYDETDLNQYVNITAQDRLSVNPVLKLKSGDKIQAWNLFNAMLVGSANDAALALARFASESLNKNFVDLMNQKAGELGMSESHFSNPLGFDSKYNYSTAQDLKKLVDKTQNLLAFTDLGKKTSYSFTSKLETSYHIGATNKLVGKNKEVEAIKTGFTESSNGSMISKVTKNSHSIIIIVLSSQNREADTLKLSDEVFKAYEW